MNDPYYVVDGQNEDAANEADWKVDAAERLEAEYKQGLKLDDYFESGGGGHDTESVMAAAVQSQTSFDDHLSEMATNEANRLFDELNWG